MGASDSSASRDEPVYVQGSDEFRRVVGSDPIVLVEFYADWCGPCKMLAPVLESLAAESAASVVKVDVDVDQQLAADHGVRGVPTMELYRDGEQVEQVVGMLSEDQLRDLIRRHVS